jgi:hypothetical protein
MAYPRWKRHPFFVSSRFFRTGRDKKRYSGQLEIDPKINTYLMSIRLMYKQLRF